MKCIVCNKDFNQKRRKTCSNKCAYYLRNIKKHNREKEFLKLLDKFVGLDNIKKMVEVEYHAPLMIWDFLKRDYPEVFSVDMSKKIFRELILKFFKFNHTEYNKKQNWFKLKYKFSKSTSIEELKNMQRQWAQKGQKESIKLRKKNEYYNPKQSLNYWLKKSETKKQAEDALMLYKQSNSPFSPIFYVQRYGFSYEEAAKKTKTYQVMGALAALKKVQKPKTEKEIIKFLEKNNIQYVSQFPVLLSRDERIFRKKKYIYDLYIPKIKTIIECHGTYWHCDPRIYNADDEVSFPGNRKFLASNIWDFDKHREKIAIDKGYEYFVIWENDIERRDYEKRIMSIC